MSPVSDGLPTFTPTESANFTQESARQAHLRLVEEQDALARLLALEEEFVDRDRRSAERRRREEADAILALSSHPEPPVWLDVRAFMRFIRADRAAVERQKRRERLAPYLVPY